MFLRSDYSFDLPEAQIAQTPCSVRSESRLCCVRRETGQIDHCRFKDIPSLLTPGDLLVVNNTRVIPARLFGRKETGGKIEVLILDYAGGLRHLEEKGYFQCDCLVKASKRPKKGSLLIFSDTVQARVEEVKERVCEVRFLNQSQFLTFLHQEGKIPLPPYIRRDPAAEKENRLDDRTRYQTVYAKEEGAVAAPTAGLHFTAELMARIEQMGACFAPITLHVGYGTFVPVRADDIRDHEIHSEYFDIPQETAEKINSAKADGRRVIAVGTTCVRTLEYASAENGRIRPGSGVCDLFIYPGYRFKCVDAMVTNFHLPESTLLMLVSAFYDRSRILAAYQEAVEKGYRFFSYGDAMFIG